MSKIHTLLTIDVPCICNHTDNGEELFMTFLVLNLMHLLLAERQVVNKCLTISLLLL